MKQRGQVETRGIILLSGSYDPLARFTMAIERMSTTTGGDITNVSIVQPNVVAADWDASTTAKATQTPRTRQQRRAAERAFKKEARRK